MLVPVDTYHGHMCEAIKSLRSSLRLLCNADACGDEDPAKLDLLEDAGMQSRYAFLLAANALEAGANALLKSLQMSHALYDDLEKLATLLKYEMVCMALGKSLDRGCDIYGRIKEVVRCRNEFVHPKPRMVPCDPTEEGRRAVAGVGHTKSRGYPMALEYVTPEHAKCAIGDILTFIAWIVYDLCQYGAEDGAMRLGCGSRMVTGDAILLAREYGFDIRSLDGERSDWRPGIGPPGEAKAKGL